MSIHAHFHANRHLLSFNGQKNIQLDGEDSQIAYCASLSKWEISFADITKESPENSA
jgi:hypothetical protein